MPPLAKNDPDAKENQNVTGAHGCAIIHLPNLLLVVVLVMSSATAEIRNHEGCYWCGEAAISKEHVPPSNLFPSGHNTNLITVPSCAEHNEKLHKLDERFRVYIQARETNPLALQAFQDKTFRSLSRPERPGLARSLAAKSHRVVVGGQRTLAMEINPVDQNLYFEKIIRGMYFHLFGRRVMGRVISFSRDFIIPDFNYDNVESRILPIINDPNMAVLGKAANPKVFQFKYAIGKDGDKEAFVIVLRFYEGVEVFGLVN
jgi:hypothetical protein